MKNRMTISKFAEAGGVGVETVRYYQRRGLLAIPNSKGCGYREYNEALLQQLRFIRKAQAAGFSLDEIKELTMLDPFSDRLKIQKIAKSCLHKLTMQIENLNDICNSLRQSLHECEHGNQGTTCPIVHAFKG